MHIYTYIYIYIYIHIYIYIYKVNPSWVNPSSLSLDTTIKMSTWKKKKIALRSAFVV